MSQRIDEEEKREESAGKKMEEVLFYGVSGNNYIYSGNDRHCCLCRVRGVGGIRAEDGHFRGDGAGSDYRCWRRNDP